MTKRPGVLPTIDPLGVNIIDVILKHVGVVNVNQSPVYPGTNPSLLDVKKMPWYLPDAHRPPTSSAYGLKISDGFHARSLYEVDHCNVEIPLA